MKIQLKINKWIILELWIPMEMLLQFIRAGIWTQRSIQQKKIFYTIFFLYIIVLRYTCASFPPFLVRTDSDSRWLIHTLTTKKGWASTFLQEKKLPLGMKWKSKRWENAHCVHVEAFWIDGVEIKVLKNFACIIPVNWISFEMEQPSRC